MEENTYWNEEVETMAKGKLDELEGRMLCREVAYIFEHSPFYRRKMEEKNLAPESIKGLDDLPKLPFTTKDDLRESQMEFGGLGGHQCAPKEKIVRIQGTSGTTGRPLYVGLTARDADHWKELFARHAWTGGLRPGDSFVNPANFTLFVGGLSECVSAEAMGVCVIPAPLGSTGVEKLMEIIHECRPTVLFSTPSAASFLAQIVRNNLKKDPRDMGFKKGFLAGEALAEKDRAVIEETWGITARNFYGLADVAADLASECDHLGGLHFCGQLLVRAELIDPVTLEPLEMRSGAEGEIVYTTIDREATPVLRYRCRDMVRINADPCSCSRTSFRFTVIGRSDDMLKVKGVNVYPSAVKDVISSFSPRTTGEMRIVLYEPGPAIGTNLEIKVECGEAIKEDERKVLSDQIKMTIKNKLVFTPIITMVPPGSLEKSTYKIDYFERVYQTRGNG
jgi:phenylacetate-CoA ligase